MLRIKLARFGKKNQPHYRIVVTERKSKRDGQYQALIGTYVPTQTPKILEINKEALREWLSKGAQPTDTVASLIKRFESGTPFPEKKARPSKKAVAKAAAAKAEAESATEAATTDTAKAAPEVSEPETAETSEATETAATEEKSAE